MNLHQNPGEAQAYTRRQFMHRSLVLASATAAVPHFIQQSAFGLPMPAANMSSMPGVPEDHVLVVIQLSGGNDGLNTVVPFGWDDYYRVRPRIGIPADRALALGSSRHENGIGLHPAMQGVKRLYDDGLASIVQGVGYPNPNRSHFASMDIWHTADTDGTGEGWLARYFDAQCCGYGKGESGSPDGSTASSASASAPGIAMGRTAPLAMDGGGIKPIAFETPDLFRWTGNDVHEALEDPYHEIVRRGVTGDVAPDSNAAFLMRTALDAQVSSDLIRQAVAARPLVEYPNSGLARQLTMISAMIRAGLKTRVYYATLGGFDTHAGQGGENGSHANLLRQLSEATDAFYRDLRAQENDSRVLTMSFSEFGRRVGQNASGGTDHGTAAPVMLFGPMVRAGVVGKHPSLTDLDQGDLKYTIDFRSVYAGILEGWLGADPRAILRGRHTPLPVVKA